MTASGNETLYVFNPSAAAPVFRLDIDAVAVSPGEVATHVASEASIQAAVTEIGKMTEMSAPAVVLRHYDRGFSE